MPVLAVARAGGAATRRRAAIAAWIAVVVATQRWNPWSEGITHQYATDVTSYERIARAAPGLPAVDLPLQHAERWAPHWLVGVVASGAGIPLHDVYRIATWLVLLGVVLAVDATLAAARIGPRAHALALGLLIASAYPVHYLLAAPGMLADAVFLLGLALVPLGFARGSLAVVLAGLAVGTLGRQNMAPLGLAAALWVAFAPAWRGRRRVYAAVCAVLPAALYAGLHAVASGFAQSDNGSFTTITVLGSLGEPRALADHVGRALLTVIVPVAVLAGSYRPGGPLPRGALLLGGAVFAETLALGPGWTAHAEPRLAALSLPALAVAAGVMLDGIRLDARRAALVAAGILLASLHHLYTRLPTDRPAAWEVLSVVGAALALVALLRVDVDLLRRQGRRRG